MTDPDERKALVVEWRRKRRSANKSNDSEYDDPIRSERLDMMAVDEQEGEQVHDSGTPEHSHPIYNSIQPHYRLRKLNNINGSHITPDDTVKAWFGKCHNVAAEAILDSGTDRTVISNELLSAIQSTEAVEVLPLARPVRLEMADGKSIIVANRVALLDIAFILKTGTIALR